MVDEERISSNIKSKQIKISPIPDLLLSWQIIDVLLTKLIIVNNK